MATEDDDVERLAAKWRVKRPLRKPRPPPKPAEPTRDRER